MSCAVFTFIGVYAAATSKGGTWVFWASFVAAIVMLMVASFLVWRDEHEKLISEQTKLAKPDIRCEIREVFIDRIASESTVRLSDSFVTLALRLENHSPVPTTIETVAAVVHADGFTVTGRFLPLQLGHQTEKEVFPGDFRPYHELPIDTIITRTEPLSYGHHQDCWAHFFVEGLPPRDYKNAEVGLTLKDGLGESHECSKTLDFQLDKMKHS